MDYEVITTFNFYGREKIRPSSFHRTKYYRERIVYICQFLQFELLLLVHIYLSFLLF